MTIVRLGGDVVSSSPAARQFFFIYIYIYIQIYIIYIYYILYIYILAGPALFSGRLRAFEKCTNGVAKSKGRQNLDSG